MGVEGLLASRSLLGSLARTAVLVSTLSTAVAMMVSVGIMVGSFRDTVAVWLENRLVADLYLRPAGSAGIDSHPTLDLDIADRIEALDEVRCFRLGGRIYDLKARGYEIETRMVTVPSGARVASYRLIAEPAQLLLRLLS